MSELNPNVRPQPVRPYWLVQWQDLESVDVRWIARCLSGIHRYGNKTPVPWSVARHSVLVSCLLPPHNSHRTHMLALLHDVHEIWTGDVLRPARDACGDGLRQLQRQIDDHIFSLLKLPVLPFDLQVVAEADDWAIDFELQCIGQNETESPVAGVFDMSQPDEQLWLEHWERWASLCV